MQLPSFGQNQQQAQYYQMQQPDDSKKKMLLFGGGVVILLILLGLVLFGGGGKAGQADMQSALKSTSEALGIIDGYDQDLRDTPTKNDVALTQILLRGNFQKLNDLYKKTYSPKSGFTAAGKADKASIATLDRSDRNNTLDSDILKVLNAKVKAADAKLVAIKPNFTKPSSKQAINDSIADMNSIQEILTKDR